MRCHVTPAKGHSSAGPLTGSAGVAARGHMCVPVLLRTQVVVSPVRELDTQYLVNDDNDQHGGHDCPVLGL